MIRDFILLKEVKWNCLTISQLVIIQFGHLDLEK